MPSNKTVKILFFLLLFLPNLLHSSCKKVEVKNDSNRKIDPYYFGTWQLLRMIEKDTRNSSIPVLTTTYHSEKTPLPRRTYKENGDLITVYPNANYAAEVIYNNKWEMFGRDLFIGDESDGVVTQQGADSFVKMDYEDYYNNTIYYTIQTEWKRIK